MKCHNCGNKINRNAQYCHSCGTQKADFSEHSKDSVKISRSKLLYVSIVLLVLIGTLIVVAPTSTYHYEVEVPYEDTEYYTEKQPYQAQESYQAQEAYESTETYTDQVPIQSLQTNIAEEGRHYPSCDGNCYCTRYEGIFTRVCVECTCSVTNYESIRKERPVTKYQTVTKTRTVTKYRDVQKSRKVMKTKMDPREHEVNWLMKFRVPYTFHVVRLSEDINEK